MPVARDGLGWSSQATSLWWRWSTKRRSSTFANTSLHLDRIVRSTYSIFTPRDRIVTSRCTTGLGHRGTNYDALENWISEDVALYSPRIMTQIGSDQGFMMVSENLGLLRHGWQKHGSSKKGRNRSGKLINYMACYGKDWCKVSRRYIIFGSSASKACTTLKITKTRLEIPSFLRREWGQL